MMYGYQQVPACATTGSPCSICSIARHGGRQRNTPSWPGLEQLIDYIKNLRFDPEDALNYLTLPEPVRRAVHRRRCADFRFTGDIYAVPEGTVVFPYEPLIRVEAPIFEAQLIETALLNIVNHQTLIATKASRVVPGRAGRIGIMEFGLRRAQGPDAGIYGARAAIIGGCGATSNVLAGQLFDVPVTGTHAHSWVMSFPRRAGPPSAPMPKLYPHAVPAAGGYLRHAARAACPTPSRVFQRAAGARAMSRWASAWTAATWPILAAKPAACWTRPASRTPRSAPPAIWTRMLIRDLKQQGACIDIWGVGTKMITSDGLPGAGRRVQAERRDWSTGMIVPKIKISENPAKITNPGVKMLYRVYDEGTGMAVADLIALDHERFDPAQPLTLFDPVDTWKTMTLANYTMKKLLVPVFVDGEQVYRVSLAAGNSGPLPRRSGHVLGPVQAPAQPAPL